ncbi:hypothetical protein E1218_35045 [Kribbella turkmenica]|uniref:Uncharacterized protein n=1 Tax=Kribbella turkmenica TaxID=2530375 RepID=A0A4R4W3C0_9ACTN|nr:hypothetical protein [Kribbella turkmenica]TDD13038.1 hypothetical protein E1218_35045 [Kribbella turkmenica]
MLWTEGEPQVLEPPSPGDYMIATDVNSKGTVLGATMDADWHARPWLYSKGTFRYLEVPAGLQAISVMALNERGDVVGNGFDSVTGYWAPVVWPAGRTPLRLPADIGSRAVDINDAGVVVGSVATEHGATGLVWKRWDAKGSPLTGTAGARVEPIAIAGNYVTGDQDLNGVYTGTLWTTQNRVIVSYPHRLDAVNTAGDVAYFDDEVRTIVSRRDGTQYVIDTPGENSVKHLFEPGGTYDAAGNREYLVGRAVVWSGCSS